MDIKHLSLRGYVVVWLLLMTFTVLSLLLSFAHLGGVDTVLALVIAGAKTLLVMLFFMHLIEQRIANGLVVIIAGLFIALLMSLTVADVETRQTFPPAPVPALPL